jgi:O-antigen biosynthesis protein
MLYILTLTWNACDSLSRLKDSLLPSLEGLDYSWLIKDNASIDKTVETASTWGDKVKVFKYKNNQQNFSQGMNYLFNEASPADNDLVLLLNNDVLIKDSKSIKSMIGLINNDDSIGAVGARLLFPNNNKLQHAGVVFNKNKNPLHFRAKEKSDDNAEKNRLFQVVTGAVLLTKAEYFKNCCKNESGNNGMNEKYH